MFVKPVSINGPAYCFKYNSQLKSTLLGKVQLLANKS